MVLLEPLVRIGNSNQLVLRGLVQVVLGRFKGFLRYFIFAHRQFNHNLLKSSRTSRNTYKLECGIMFPTFIIIDFGTLIVFSTLIILFIVAIVFFAGIIVYLV